MRLSGYIATLEQYFSNFMEDRRDIVKIAVTWDPFPRDSNSIVWGQYFDKYWTGGCPLLKV